MEKSLKFNYKGLSQDLAKSVGVVDFYYDANNIRILATDSKSTYAVTNEQGNEFILKIPDITISNIDENIHIQYDETLQVLQFTDKEQDSLNEYNDILGFYSNSKIIGHVISRNSIILFCTGRIDSMWEVKFDNNVWSIELLYVRDLNFSEEFPIDVLYNYENSKIQKIYFADSINQLRFLNIKESDLLKKRSDLLNIVSNIELSQPVVISKAFGSGHTSGMIQYAYNLLNLYGQQTSISPISELIPLGKDLGGGDVNENVGQINEILINNIDNSYSIIRLYSIKYASRDTTPIIKLITEQELYGSTFKWVDSNTSVADVTLSEFLFLGGNPQIPAHIEAKDNRLFIANIKELFFDIDNFDTRAFAYDNTQTIRVKKNYQDSILTVIDNTILNSQTIVYEKSDMINPDHDLYKYKSDGITLGRSGKYINLTIEPLSKSQILLEYNTGNNIYEIEDIKFPKSNEIYRYGIEFLNNLGQKSNPKWIADVKHINDNFLKYDSVKININQQGLNFLKLNYPTIIGFRLLRVQRTGKDKTRVTQGLLQPTFFQVPVDPSNSDPNYRYQSLEWNFNTNGILGKDRRPIVAKSRPKLPTPFLRTFDNQSDLFPGTNIAIDIVKKCSNYKAMHFLSDEPDGNNICNEIATTPRTYGDVTEVLACSFQFTELLQLYSPELIFDKSLILSGDSFINPVKKVKIDETRSWLKELRLESMNYNEDNKHNGLWLYTVNNELQNNGLPGLIGHDGAAESRMDFLHYFRNLKTELPITNKNINVKVKDTPKKVLKGESLSYNGIETEYDFRNSLSDFIGDILFNYVDGGPCYLDGMTTDGIDSALLVLDKADMLNKGATDNTLESYYTLLEGNVESNSVLVIDLCKNVVNQYNGNTYEVRQSNDYLRVGQFIKLKDIDANSNILIRNSGDTYRQNFKFSRMTTQSAQRYSEQAQGLIELISIPLETTINLKYRNDKSLYNWDNDFFVKYEDYHKYNDVYSNESSLDISKNIGFTFETIKDADTRIKASKLKSNAEIVDSWTDFLENEYIDLDGQYGPINDLIKDDNDNMYSFQDRAVSYISINPKVLNKGDGITVEIGSGEILSSYTYLSVLSGTLNKWSTVTTPTTIYYYDDLNKAISMLNGKSITNMIDVNGLHHYFNNNIEFDILRKNNPFLKHGVESSYNRYTEDVFFTFHQNKSFTLTYNELSKTFTSFYDYKPSRYIPFENKLITTHPNNNQLYEHFKGNYNEFYEETYPSDITLLVNPSVDYDTVFNNIEYKHEMYLNDLDQVNSTLTSIQSWNEYQDSGKIPLVINNNIKRKFREWRAQIPRHQKSMDRMRGPWIFLKLSFDNVNNKKMILHNIIIHFNVYPT